MPKIERIAKRFELALDPDNADITIVYLYGYVTSSRGWWDDDDYIAANEVREKLQTITTGTIQLHINSYGGEAYAGIAIHNLLKQHAAKIIVYIDGIAASAASAASLIAMAGDEVIMPENTLLQMHRASTFMYGNADAMRLNGTI